LEEETKEAGAVIQDLLATAASMVPVFGGLISGGSQTVENHKLRKAIKYLEGVVSQLQRDLSDQQAQIKALRDAFDNEKQRDLIEQGLNVAVSASDLEQQALVIELVATAILPYTSPEKIDRAIMLVDLTGQLSSAHLRVLRMIATSKKQGNLSVGHDGVTPSALEKLLPDMADIMSPLTARLNALGLIENVGTGRMGGGGPQNEWWFTDFGWKYLDFLRDATR
jgi:hypothetical protein